LGSPVPVGTSAEITNREGAARAQRFKQLAKSRAKKRGVSAVGGKQQELSYLFHITLIIIIIIINSVLILVCCMNSQMA
jgi:hypothetical protein